MTIKDVKELFPCGHFQYYDRGGFRVRPPLYPYQFIDGFDLRVIAGVVNINIILKCGDRHAA